MAEAQAADYTVAVPEDLARRARRERRIGVRGGTVADHGIDDETAQQLGLSDEVRDQIRKLIVDINSTGTSVLLVEQNAKMALGVADYGYVVETGEIVMHDDRIKAYFDHDEGGK